MQIELAIQRSDASPQAQSPESASRPKPWKPSKMFPLIVFLLLACYGLMAMVLVEQNTVIQSQRNLIQQLAQDSSQLTSLKTQVLAQRAIEKKQAEEATKPAAPPAEKACKSCKNHMRASRTQQRAEDKQPLQTADRADWRRFPSKI
jgi:CHASE1-domain containing sensor protein